MRVAYSERFDDEILVGTSSLSEVSSDFGEELQRGHVHGGSEQLREAFVLG